MRSQQAHRKPRYPAELTAVAADCVMPEAALLHQAKLRFRCHGKRLQFLP
jgi:hypothetical protein